MLFDVLGVSNKWQSPIMLLLFAEENGEQGTCGGSEVNFRSPMFNTIQGRTAMYSLLRKGTIIVPAAASSLTHALE